MSCRFDADIVPRGVPNGYGGDYLAYYGEIMWLGLIDARGEF